MAGTIHKLSIKTRDNTELIDISSDVQKIVEASGVENGVCYTFIPHTTAGIIINEHADTDVVEDIKARLEAIAPRYGEYKHMEEGNAASHIKTALTASSVTVFIEDRQLVLGTWQGIFFCEFDGPRSRNILVKIIEG